MNVIIKKIISMQHVPFTFYNGIPKCIDMLTINHRTRFLDFWNAREMNRKRERERERETGLTILIMIMVMEGIRGLGESSPPLKFQPSHLDGQKT